MQWPGSARWSREDLRATGELGRVFKSRKRTFISNLHGPSGTETLLRAGACDWRAAAGGGGLRAFAKRRARFKSTSRRQRTGTQGLLQHASSGTSRRAHARMTSLPKGAVNGHIQSHLQLHNPAPTDMCTGTAPRTHGTRLDRWCSGSAHRSEPHTPHTRALHELFVLEELFEVLYLYGTGGGDRGGNEGKKQLGEEEEEKMRMRREIRERSGWCRGRGRGRGSGLWGCKNGVLDRGETRLMRWWVLFG